MSGRSDKDLGSDSDDEQPIGIRNMVELTKTLENENIVKILERVTTLLENQHMIKQSLRRLIADNESIKVDIDGLKGAIACLTKSITSVRTTGPVTGVNFSSN